jgi:hypothetical protein
MRFFISLIIYALVIAFIPIAKGQQVAPDWGRNLATTTECDFTVPADTLLPRGILRIFNWGDNSTATDTALPAHRYRAPGKYLLRISDTGATLITEFLVWVVNPDTVVLIGEEPNGICGLKNIIACGGRYSLPNFSDSPITWTLPSGRTVITGPDTGAYLKSVDEDGLYVATRIGPGGCPLTGRIALKRTDIGGQLLAVNTHPARAETDTVYNLAGERGAVMVSSGEGACTVVWTLDGVSGSPAGLVQGPNAATTWFAPTLSGYHTVAAEAETYSGCRFRVERTFFFVSDVLGNVVSSGTLDSKNDVLVGANSLLEVEVYSSWGSLIRSKSERGAWPMPSTPAGVYYYLLRFPGSAVRKGWVEVIQ